MRTIKMLLLVACCVIARTTFAQELPANLNAAIKADDATQLATLINNDNINNCYQIGDWRYSALAQTIRSNAKKCFDLLIEKGADVNKACEGYVPPLMHAAKYGRLDMVKILVAKGAKVDYIYEGEYTPADGKTPLSYAEDNKQAAIADYFRSLKKN